MQAEGGKRTRETAAGAGIFRGAQRRAAEAGGWWEWEKASWTALRARRGGGERVYRYVSRRGTANGGGGGRRRREDINIQKQLIQVGREGIYKNC